MSEPNLDLAHLRSLCDAATPGPWRVELDGTGHYCLRAPHQSVRTVARVFCDIDAAFIAAARVAVPRLLDEVARLRAERDAAVAAERERCAALADRLAASWGKFHDAMEEAAQLVAVHIRKGTE